MLEEREKRDNYNQVISNSSNTIIVQNVLLFGINSNLNYLNQFSGFSMVTEAVSALSSGINTMATNFMQCIDKGPRIVYTPLDMENPTTTQRTSTTTTERPISGMISEKRVKKWAYKY